MIPKYYSLEESVNLIDEPNKSPCYKILSENEDIFRKARGSSHNHQAWEGGYLQHLAETMNVARLIYNSLNSARELPFSLSDVILSLFHHDIEKPWKQSDKSLNLERPDGFKDNDKIKDFRLHLIKKYNFILSEEHINAINYAEGEGDDYKPRKRVQFPLAAFVHMCDVASARIWHDFPKVENSW